MANPALTALASTSDGIGKCWQNYLTSIINTNTKQQNLSLEDFGVWSVNRPYTYSTWSQLPMPDALNDQSSVAVLQTLSDSAITYPFLTNMFDMIQIEVFKSNTNTANRIINTGKWRACDLHNRKLLLYTNAVNSVSLWMSAYAPGITNTGGTFTNYAVGTNAVCVQIAKATITSTVSNLPVRITYTKRVGLESDPAVWLKAMPYLGDSRAPINCSVSDMSSIMPGVGSVSPAMLQAYARDYWNLQQKRATNSSFVPAVTDEAGDAVMIMNLSFFEKLWNDNQLNQNLHSVRCLSWNSYGIASFTHLANSQMQVKLNMTWMPTFLIGNAMATQGSADAGLPSLNNYFTMSQALSSSAEYTVLGTVWGDQYAVSAIRLLQMSAESWRSNGTAQPLELNIENYATLGNKSYSGYGAGTLKSQIPAMWNVVTNVFATEEDSNFIRILITPGQLTNSTGLFKGMSMLRIGQTQFGDYISDNQTVLNGGFGDLFAFFGSGEFTPSYDLTYNLQYSPPDSSGGLQYITSGGTYTFIYNNFTVPQPQFDFSQYDLLNLTAPAGTVAQTAFTPQQNTQGSIIALSLNLSSGSTANAIKSEADVGWFGNSWAGIKQAGTIAADPVQVVSGDFYADSVDLALAGPMPLQLRRNYQSRNLANDQFGAGWKMSIMPWLVVTTNTSGNGIIYASEMDGAVVAYRSQSNSVWSVTSADNPDMANFTPNGIGGTANLFDNSIQQNATNSQIYTLFGSDGSQRVYQVMTNFAIVNGTNQLNRIRPYLTLWQDHAGNYYQFIYGTNATSDDFGQLYRVQGANGTSLTFKYDFYGRITLAVTDDSRMVNYQYDNYGDLVGVTLPDNTGWAYGYQHYSFTTNSHSYTDSYHLLTTETKPDGRQLVNTYDNLRRVTMQQATVGLNRELITNAWFFYTNNCTGLTNSLISGVTCVQDAFHNPYYYYYTNNLITQAIQPLGRTNIQNWYVISETNKPGYYENSLEYAVDARGLTNWFQYDSNGNITNQITSGDLTGNGIGGDSATNSFTYTTNNCIAKATDASGNQSTFNYDSTDTFRLVALQLSNGGVGIATNRWFYTNVTSIVDMGGWFQTNSSFGLCALEIKADVATNAWTYNGRGFPTQLTRYAVTADVPGNTDPAVTTYLAFTPRGDLVSATDAAGRQVTMSHDAMGRLQWRDVFDENNNSLSRETFYYNKNGELEWYDGPRSNPDDYVLFNYDGAGRKVQESHWLSCAKPNGSGIQAASGANQYSTTFSSYDYFGNQTSITDQRGAFTTNSWDALGRLTQRMSFDTDGATLLATEGFGYEAGGLVQYYTNALGGITTTLYNSTGQPRARQNADGSTNGWTYNLDGRLHREIQGNGAYWETTYNDAALTATRIFYSATGNPLATNSIVLDRRGNASLWTDAGRNTFTNYFDGLGRLKAALGPQLITITGGTNNPGGIGNGYTTNVLQQIITYLYDSSGKILTVSNALGEATTTTFDAIGRTLATQTYGTGGGTPVRTSTIAYAADNNSFTATTGSGASAISTTTYTDTYGRPLLSVGSPAANSSNFILRNYDSVGNLASETQASIVNNALITWQTTSMTYDGLNRVQTLTERDNAVTTFSYDPAGDLTNRFMPGANLTWAATYNSAGQILTEKDNNGGLVTRSTTYTYYAAGSPFAGLPTTVTDGAGVARTGTYDDWLRVTNVTTTGSLSEQQMTMGWKYDPRGFITDLSQSFASTNTGASTEVQRSFDVYGQLASESVYLGGNGLSGFSQTWNAAGRRTQLAGSTLSANFAYRADGLMTTGGGSTFGYANNGLLTGRTNSFRAFTISQRDGVGHPLLATTTVGFSTALAESWNWLGDGSPAVYIAQRSDFTDTRNFAYGSLNRRLAQETFNVGSGQIVTNAYTFDNGASGGMGILTTATESSSTTNSWGGGLDVFSRVVNGTNTVAHRPAYGSINGPANVTATLDGHPIAVTLIGTNGGQWRATLDLTAGTHQLTASASPPGSLFVTNATATFTNSAADTSTNTFNGNGQITQRIWFGADGQTNRIQTLTWDAFNRLVKVSERDNQNSGYNWQADFDPLGRRIRTTTVNVTNNVVMNSQPTAIVHFYDPQVEFLEIGVNVNGGLTTWKNYGPDLDGVYGSQQGLGGLESLTTGLSSVGLLQDGFGNVLGSVTNMAVTWNAARVNGYGPVAGYPALSLESAPLTAEHLAWRGKWRDMTGLYYWGARPYDSERRAFLSTDPYGHAADDSLYAAFYGSPTVYWDPDGRFGKQYANFQYNGGIAGYGLRSLAEAFNYVGSSTRSAYVNWGAFNDASFLNMAASAVTPSSYVSGFNSLQNRAENTMVGEYLNGSGNTWTAAQGLSSVVGDVVGYNGVMTGGFGVDRQSTTLLSTSDRWSQGLMGGSQLILTGVGLKTTYNPNATFLSPSVSVPPVIGQGETPLWQVGRHGDMPSPRPSGYESHHGVNSVWSEANVPGYEAADAPAVLMRNDPFHNATRGVFNRFRSEIAARQGVSPRSIDWSQVSPGTAWRLAEDQFQAAQTPLDVQEEFFREFNQYLESLRQ
jgi:RHS repeat-associated protein